MAEERMVAVQFMVDIRYGREDDEIMGLQMSREMCIASVSLNSAPMPQRLTEMQVWTHV